MTNLAECNRIISELILLLKADIKQLRSGKYDEIQQLYVLKTEKSLMLTAAMNEFSGSENFLQSRTALRDKLLFLNALGKENSKLLLAVSNGIKSANQRIHRLKNTHTQVGVYGRQGATISFMEDPASSEEKF